MIGGKMRKIIEFIFIFFFFYSISIAGTTNSISQYGVTWTFDKNYEYGTFANGDYWVLGPVRIVSITPVFTGVRAGWEVNPTAGGTQGFDINANLFDASLVPALPYVAKGGESLVKQVPNTNPTTNSVTSTMAVLTVVDQIPQDNGASLFRPPYAGTDKPYYSLSMIKIDRLLSIQTRSSGISYDELREWFKHPHIEIGEGGAARKLRFSSPNQYGPAIAGALNAAIAKLSSYDSLQSKWQTLIWVIQSGIDRYHCSLTGQRWPGGSGHEPGHKLSVAFAAYMLDHPGMKSEVTKTYWWENKMINNSLWGYQVPEQQYWSYIAKDPGYNLEYGDPYKYIDGGNNLVRKINSYQIITGNIIKGEACWLLYFPSMQDWWSDSNSLIEYAKRWVYHGLKAKPDPCAPMHPEDIGKNPSSWRYYGSLYGPDGKGGCINGPGRFSDERDGISKDEGQYQSEQMNEMWNIYFSGKLPGSKGYNIPKEPRNLHIKSGN